MRLSPCSRKDLEKITLCYRWCIWTRALCSVTVHWISVDVGVVIVVQMRLECWLESPARLVPVMQSSPWVLGSLFDFRFSDAEIAAFSDGVKNEWWM